jgi:hypothetical protein
MFSVAAAWAAAGTTSRLATTANDDTKRCMGYLLDR